MAGEFDESKHPRAKDGKFGSGGGGAGDGGGEVKHPLARDAEADPQGRAYRAAVAAHDHALSGTPDAMPQFRVEPKSPEEAQAIGRQAYEAEHATIAAEAQAETDLHAAVAAGHIDDAEPRAALEQMNAAGESDRSEMSSVSEDLHASMDSAADAVAAFSAADTALSEYDADLEDLGIERHDVETADVVAGMEGASSSFTPDGDGKNYEDLSDNHKIDVSHIDAPDEGGDGVPTRDQYESDEDFSAATEHWGKYKADVEKVNVEYLDRANKAQTALEALHEKQTSAIERTKAAGKRIDAAQERATASVEGLADAPESLVNHKAFEGHDRAAADDEDGSDDPQFTDPKVQADYDRAHAVANDLADRYWSAVEEGPDTGFNHDDIVETLKDSARSTAATIKRLSKVTGRAPNIAAKKPKAAKPKKSVNRPDGTSTASVAVMARHKLRLSKLDFISLVDSPAQATATVRLIKRAGGRDAFRARATAKLVKVADGANPLAYFWAFTCTDETGAPYHDLQGDAIAPDAFVKAAEEFMASTAAVDEMHDGKQTSRVAFAFPMDSDIAAGMFGDAIGKQLKTSGLMVAIRPSPDALAKLRSGAYTGVSIAGLGTREVAKKMPPWLRGKKPGDKKKPKRYGKQAVLTSETDGHVHSIDLDDPADCYSDHLSTSYQTAEGADQGHNHAWVYDAMSGAIAIAADSGHTHTVSAVVPADVIARAAADEDDNEDDGTDDDSDGRTITVINARAPAGKSPPGDAAATVKAQEQVMATEQETKIAELTKTVERLTALAGLTDTQKAYHATLTGQDATAFLAKSAAERSAIVEPLEVAKRALQEVVYVSASGETYRKSHDPALVAMAKRLDASEAATQQVTLEKRAGADLSHFAKALTVRAAIVKAIDGIADEAVRNEAHEAIKGANAAMTELCKSKGTDGGGAVAGDATPVAKFNDARVSFAKAKLQTEAPSEAQIRACTGEFIKTAKGSELYADLQSNRAQA